MTIVSISVGKNPLEETETVIVNERVWNAVLGYKLKNDRMISVHFQGKPFNIVLIQVYYSTIDTEKLKLTGSMKIYNTF